MSAGIRPARRTLAGALAVLAVTALVPATAAAQTPASRTPWATINACDPPQRPASVGVRVSVPNRRDLSQWVRIRIQFFDARRKAWRVVRSGGDAGFTRLSDGGGRVQGGTTFVFTPPRAGARLKLRGLVDVEWRRGRSVRLDARLITEGGHADPADPLLTVSQPLCEIRR
ncbi:MAG: hypothetical protein QOC64_3659 [Solirubrobacteraceae bacterium]|nr:hypothetical protein [Solirubrobacteraceae bacterium]